MQLMTTTFGRTLALVIVLAASGAAWWPRHAVAHHGWSWTDDGNVELTGVIRSVRLGNPHGVLEVDVDGEIWTVEVGQPWRNERAGLKQGELAEGVEFRAIGQAAADAADRRLKVERFYLGDREYQLYPERD